MRGGSGGLWGAGERVTWVAALILMLSAFMDWYAGSGVGVKLAVIGWHTGILGKLVFIIGLAVLLLVVLRESGFELPPSVPESLLVVALGALATIFVLIRVFSVPDSMLAGRRPRHRHLDQPARWARRHLRRRSHCR